MTQLVDWFGNPINVPEKNANPCIAVHGPGPEGQTCKGCSHLSNTSHHSGRFWKCDLRKVSHGRATDHKVSWPACAKFEKAMGLAQ
jgi:hypothetical protein